MKNSEFINENKQEEIEETINEYSNILINNHIYYIKEIEEKYSHLKKIFKYGIPNKVLFCYCEIYSVFQNIRFQFLLLIVILQGHLG